MELKEIEMNISELELRLDRLRALYDQYFIGYEKLEPQVQRKDIDRRFQILRKENFRNTALRFRLNVAVQKYSTYQTYCQRICRQIEEGTYKRHIQRAKERFGADAGRRRKAKEADLELDTDADLAERDDMSDDEFLAKLDADGSRTLADTLGFANMHFHHLTVEDAIAAPALPAEVDIVTALHACDTATDDAIRFALARRARHIVLVPCCQAEVAATLRQFKNASFARTPLSELWRHPIHTREFGSQVTNVLRCLLHEAHGYQLTVTELVGWELSMKNELIVARATGKPRGNARERAGQILAQLNLDSLGPRFLY